MRVQIIQVQPISTPDGQKLQMAGFFTDPERGTLKPFTCRGKPERFPNLKPGIYDCTFTGYVMEGMLRAYLSALTPVAAQSASQPRAVA